MPQLSEKGKTMPASPIRKLVPFADAAKQRGIHVYHLNIGQPDIDSPQVALNAIRNYNGKIITYCHSAGNISYRKGLVEYYKSIGIDITPDNIMVTTGGSEAIIITMMACINPGDEIIIPEPFYTNYNAFAQQAGVTVKPIKTTIENNFALPPIEEFERIITPRTKAIMICNPNNPTGYLYSPTELDELRQIVLKHDIFLFADEVYREFCYDGLKHVSCMTLKDIEQNVVLFDSVSKRYSLCGVRVGNILSRNKEVLNAALRFGQARLCPPFYGQIAAEAALQTPKIYFENAHNEYVERRNYLVKALNEIEGVQCPMPKGAFYTVAKLPVDDAEHFAKWLLNDFSLDGKTVMVAPAAGFYATPGCGKDEVRIAYVLKIADLKEAIKCLREALKIYPGRIK